MSEPNFNKPLYFHRVAVKSDADDQWHWFSPPIALYPPRRIPLSEDSRFLSAMAVLEMYCKDALQQYGTEHCKIVQAPTMNAYVLCDMTITGEAQP